MPRQRTLEDIKEIARSRNGRCLSTEYKGQSQKLKWACEKGHEWEASMDSVRKGAWCGICSGYRRTIADMKALASERGGECLSTEYVRGDKPLLWRCAEGHEWNAIPENIAQGRWCGICGRKNMGAYHKLSLEEMRELAKSKGGECLSTEYVNSQTKLRWKCAEGHEWEAIPNKVRFETWCPVCGRIKQGLSQRLGIEEMQRLARERGGECLSSEYLTAHVQLRWRCAEGHEWETEANNVRTGRWCPICSQGVSEAVCKAVLEHGFGKSFPKVRPKWLRNDDGRQMELDGYCAEIGLAFEYNGPQHYKQIEYFQNSAATFQKRVRDDERKAVLCREKNIKLLVIPYTVKLDSIAEYIYQQCKQYGFEVDQKNFYWLPKEVYRSNAIRIEAMRELASSREGKCISEHYVSATSKLKWECVKGHVWEATPNSVLGDRGSWCPTCAGKRKTVADMQQLAATRGGRCLSAEYKTSMTPLRWQCAEGHEWDAPPSRIKSGAWCRQCAHARHGDLLRKRKIRSKI